MPERNYGDAQRLPIWKVARATSAAPGYFEPIKIQKGNGTEFMTFKDGGFGSNNPSQEAYRDIIRKHGGLNGNMGPFISIGTGDKPLKKFAGDGHFHNIRDAWTNLKAAVHMASRTKHVHEIMKSLSYFDNEEQFPYFRFDGGERLGKMKLGEWKSHHFTWLTGRSEKKGSKTLQEMTEAVTAYLRKEDVQRDLNECAKILVERRRLRSRNGSAWDRYASFSYYECEFKGCQKLRINTIHGFKQHVRREHPHQVPNEPLEKTLLQYRKVHWMYGQISTGKKGKGNRQI